MPPASPPSEHNSELGDYPTLTNEDVALLYQIITSAEQHSNVAALPFRAIFAAYDNVLEQHGINPNHDQVYLRFLFRLGDRKRPGDSLYQCFEALLEECGIRIELDPNKNDVQEFTTNLDDDDDDKSFENETPGAVALSDTTTPKRSRRVSFESFYDANENSIRPIGLLPRPQARTSFSQVNEYSVPERRPSTRATTRQTEKTETQPLQNRSVAPRSKRERLTAKEFASSFDQKAPRSNKENYTSIGKVAQATASRHRRLSSPAEASGTAGAFDDDNAPLTDRVHVPYAPNRDALLYRLSETQLMRDVNTFQYYRLRHVARTALQKWCVSAFRVGEFHRNMQQKATTSDLETLLRQGFQQWRTSFLRKKKRIQTRRFFETLEGRASKARDLYLLTKAFTHWAQSSSDHVVRTSIVRQHLLGLKYFNAWHEITVVNELKVRHHRLSKYLRTWKQAHGRNCSFDSQAVILNAESVVKNAYWRWFWTFCNRRAPEWRTGKLKKKILGHWNSRQHQISRKNLMVVDLRKETIARWSFSRWLESIRAMRSHSRNAESFNRQRRITYALSIWRLHKTYAPRVQQLCNMVDWRVAGTTFATIVTRYRADRQADMVDRLRLIRNAWTSWNDALRQEYLMKRINDRVVIEQLYRWALAQRRSLIHRSCERRLKRRVLSRLATAFFGRTGVREAACRHIQASTRQNRMKSIIVHWSSRMTTARQRNDLAFEFHAPRVAQEVLQAWSFKAAQLQQLQIEAKKAAFYLLAKRVSKVWRSASTESKRVKRRNGYIQVRRNTKMRLAIRVFRQWQDQTSERLQFNEKSHSSDQTRLLNFAAGLFDEWKARASLLQAHHDQAEQHYAVILAGQYLQQWSDRLRAHWRLEDLARLNDEMRISSVALGWLHKVRLRAIEVRGREANSQSLRRFYEKRHLQAVLRRWRDTVAKKWHRPAGRSLPSGSRLHDRPFDADSANTVFARAPGPSAFDHGSGSDEWIPSFEAAAGMTPLSGFLSTPSKRASRAKELVGMSTTPAGTPFQLRLRSHLAAAPHSQRRTELGKSTILRESTFAAILEASPRTPGEG